MTDFRTFRMSDGLRLHYAVDDFTDPWRPAETLVLLHAAMGSVDRFRGWVPTLARDFRVVRLDTRGHGRSDTPATDAVTIERLTRDVVELLDDLGCASAHVCGTSAGGYSAMSLAITEPARVRRLALYSSTPGLKHSTADVATWCRIIRAKGVGGMIADTVTARVDPARVDAGFIRWMIDDAQKMDREFTCRFLTAAKGFDLAPRLHEIEAPTLIVVPGADVVGTKEGYELLRRIPRHEYVVYEGMAHNITNGAPERCAADLRRFLLDRGSTS